MTGKYENYRVNSRSGCWEWQGYADSNGYGRVYDPSRPAGKRTDWVHRAFCERHKGPIPPKQEVDHTCENTICVNPDHLEAVTRVEHVRRTYERLGINNKHRLSAILRATGLTYAEIAEAVGYIGRNGARDAVESAIAKGLVEPDSVPPARRLSDEEKADIRELYLLGVPQTELGAWYRIDSSYISRICAGLDKKAERRKRGMAA